MLNSINESKKKYENNPKNRVQSLADNSTLKLWLDQTHKKLATDFIMAMGSLLLVR